jgi:hypothetical protein
MYTRGAVEVLYDPEKEKISYVKIMSDFSVL